MAGVNEALLRNVDLFARTGTVMLPYTAAERAVEIAERLRQAVAALALVRPSGQTVSVTVSIGVVICSHGSHG
jgi:diguanylate cyclase (GGDEF)-like protein